MNAMVEHDIHILRYFSSLISVSNGKVVNVTEPKLEFCPLASHLYKGLKNSKGADKNTVKQEIKNVIESKIRDYGFFTSQRKLLHCDTAIPYGASEMLMFALKKRAVDAVVVVCDGAGTVITDNSEVVQGIGARMNSLLFTSPIKEIISNLKKLNCHVVFNNALINQAEGVKRAVEAGYKKIAVTVNGRDAGQLKEIRQFASANNVSVTILVVCTTGITSGKIEQIRDYADVVWSCTSLDVRQKIGAAALLQISKQIPVFVLTKKGMDFTAFYADDKSFLSGLDEHKQYLVSSEPGGSKTKLGIYNCFLREERLPVLYRKNFAKAKSQEA